MLRPDPSPRVAATEGRKPGPRIAGYETQSYYRRPVSLPGLAMTHRFRPLPCLVLLSLAGSPALLAASTPEVKLKDGVQCTAKPDDAYEGETHRCYFAPEKFGKRDFSTRNGRATYVFSTIGQDCDEVEILGDGNSTLTSPGGGELKQVSVHCEK
jgi:hypothetical protein